MKTILIAALLLINLFAFALYGIDKAKAKRGAWRIPEATLLLVAFLGGSFGIMSASLSTHILSSGSWSPCF